ncbi:MAG: DUF4215 domain-containing protein [bacterium]
MFRHKKKIILVLVLAGVLAVGSFVFAQNDLGLNEFAGQTNLGTKSIGQIIAEIVRIFLSVLGSIAVILLLYAGFLWMTSAGDVEKIATAKKLIMNAVIGLAIILSSLAITQFIIGALEKATGTSISGEASPGGGAGGGGFGADSFVVRGISPQGNLPIRNVVVRVDLSHAVDPSLINGNILITKKSDNGLVDMNFSVDNGTINLIPSISCPAPNDNVKCFEANTAYKVEVKMALKDTFGKNLICGGLAPKCAAEFTTGSAVDAQAPAVSISYPDPGQSVPQNGLVDVWANATDDSAISHIEFFADGAYFDKDFPPNSATAFLGKVLWNTTGVAKGSHTLAAKAYDIDSNNSFSQNLNVAVRAEHCFNAIKDSDETAIDCGGADCAVCTGGVCNANGECASGSCQSGACVDTPLILGVSPTDGAPGTYVTISGRYFGAVAGTVTFLGGAGANDDKTAQLAPCSGAWSEQQIVVIVPQGIIASGPIEVKNAIGADTTDNARGPVLPNYIITPTLRPGICSLTPTEGKSGTDFNIAGDNFGGSQGNGLVKFGTAYASPKTWGNKLIMAMTPVLSAGQNSVSVVQNNAESNAVAFNLLSPTAGTKPLINYVNPDKGPIGEYITIFGSNFGDKIGVVEFLRADGTKATGDANFPAACGVINYWHNGSITIKVPDKFADGSFTKNTAASLRVRRADNELSNSVPFNINSDAPSPGICGLLPNNGPIGATVDILGERFGAGGSINFYNNVSAAPGAWGSEVIKTIAPNGAVSGPVKITVAGKDSNSVNFSIGDCGKTPGLCGVDEQCCKSSCIAKAAVCEAGPKEGAYGWRISTGIIPKAPRVVEDCSAGASAGNPSPAPWDTRPGGNSVCLNAIVNIGLDSKLDANTVIMNGVAADTAALYKCTETAPGKDPCSSRIKVGLDSQNSGLYSTGLNSDGIQMYPSGGLEQNTRYLVELATGIKAAGLGGGFMDEKLECGLGLSYCFRFKTADSVGLCRVGGVVVSPQNLTSTKQELLDYLASPKAKEDVCININGSLYSYLWSASDPGKAAITKTGIDTGNNIKPNAAVIQTLNETLPDNPVLINSFIPAENARGAGNLSINFADPAVVAKWPSCNTACVNSVIGAEFNIDMDSATIIPANIRVFKCKTENCDIFDGLVAGNINYKAATKQLEFVPLQNLEINKFYLTQLDASAIKSSSGVGLTGANSGKYFVWQFQTRSDTASCAINKINVNPEAATLNFIGQKLTLDSDAFGAPDNCSPQGQKLNNYSFNWGWLSTQPPAASLLLSGAYNVLPLTAKGCNEICLHTGSKPNASVCGNGKVEKGESCDDNNVRNGDGCSFVCLSEGTAASICGNNIKDKGEDCDDGNTTNGDGCSSRCLAEGAPAGKSICGNGFIGKGENCDDGNAVSGDGCSSQCLNEGSESGIASCGNSIIEAGEDCDDGNTVNGDGCFSACLSEGSIAGNSVCGNNAVEKGENCDDGNTIFGDGCSDICLLEGSSIKYAPPSICGDGATGKGEDTSCEAGGAADANIDPRQYASAVGKGTTKIQATVNNVKGESSVEVLCVYTTDAQCAPAALPGETLGAGSDNCCYVKPQIIKAVPPENSTGACRNALITFTFNQIMNNSAGSVSIDEAKNGACAAAAPSADGLWCESAIKATRNAFDDKATGQTAFNFNIASVLKSNTKYRVQANDFKNSQGVAAINYGWTFTAGADICKFEKINFNPNPVIFNKVETKPVAGSAISLHNGEEQAIAPVAGVYEWSWSWTPVDVSDSVSLANANSSAVLATSKQKNGSGFLNATADIVKDIYNLSDTKKIIGQVPLTVFLCENPWPADANGLMAYFTDPDPAKGISAPGNNFKTYYCRDAGAGKKLLPYLSAVNISANLSAGDIVRELLFTEPESGDAIGIRVYKNLDNLSPLAWYKSKEFTGQPQASAIDGYDAISDGRSIYINAANHTDAGANYTNMFVVSYSQDASAEMQNIHKQILDNLKFNTNLTDLKQCQTSGKLCASNLDCGTGEICLADKTKLARDAKRLANLNDIVASLETYKTAYNSYPQILSGSFLRGLAVSVWPSWQAALGNDLGKALPADPINKHAACPAGYDSATCWNGALGSYVCPAGSRIYNYKNITQDKYQLGSDFEYNNAIGWSNINSNFAVNGICSGQVVGTVSTCGDGVVGAGEECEKGNTSTESCLVNGKSGFRKLTCKSDCSWDRTAACGAGQCGDGVKQANEVCDDGQNNGKYGYCNTSCSGLIAYCGDGIKNGSEQCDLGGAINGQYGSGCSWDCKTPGPSCGDQIINGGEVCDGNSETTKDAVPGLPACGIVNGYQTYRTRACQSNCAWPAWSACQPAGACGNGVKEGTEQCDTGGGSGTGGSCVMDLAKTPTPYACRTATCGDGYLETGKEACDQGGKNGQKCTTQPGLTCDYCSTACTVVTITMPVCGNNIQEEGEACDKGTANGKIGSGCTIDCQIPPVCGDGKIEGDEQCEVSGGGFIWKFNNLTQSSAPSCGQLNWGNQGTVGCNKNSCKFYGGGCSEGPLSQGDVRVKLSWHANDINGADLDSHLAVPSVTEVYYSNKGTIFSSPYAWLSWDDTQANKGPDINGDGKADGLEILTFTQHDGSYYPGAYKFFVHSYSQACLSSTCSYMKVEVYDFNHQNAPLRTYAPPALKSGDIWWNVFQMDGASANITDINTVGPSKP